MLTPRLRYVIDDFKEEDLAVKQSTTISDVDHSQQRPINIGLVK
jgi:hypothetical protein